MSENSAARPSRVDAPELLRFLLTGGAGAVLYVAISTAALAHLPLSAAAIGIGTHAALIPLMFFAQRTLAFRSRGSAPAEFAKYALLQIASISASTLLFARFASDDWKFNAVVFTVIAGASAVLSYLICRAAIFSRRA